jgi:DNA-directed RNA polymerase subunit RPC12/RpoP
LVMEALTATLKNVGVLHQDAQPNGPELLLAAQEYNKHYASSKTIEQGKCTRCGVEAEMSKINCPACSGKLYRIIVGGQPEEK